MMPRLLHNILEAPGEAHIRGHRVCDGCHLGQLSGPDGAPELGSGGGVHQGGADGAGGVGGGGMLQPHRLQGLCPERTKADQGTSFLYPTEADERGGRGGWARS